MSETKTRLDRIEYGMLLAIVASMRSTCNKRQVGCVITDGSYVLATGYNGAPRKKRHCTKEGCLKNEDGKCIRCVHAEINAIVQLPSMKGNPTDLYFFLTDAPCLRCLQAISAIPSVGQKKIYYLNDYDCKDRDSFYVENHNFDFMMFKIADELKSRLTGAKEKIEVNREN